MEVKILGSACVNCLKLEFLVAQALKEMEREAKILKIVDDKEISKYRRDPSFYCLKARWFTLGCPSRRYMISRSSFSNIVKYQ